MRSGSGSLYWTQRHAPCRCGLKPVRARRSKRGLPLVPAGRMKLSCAWQGKSMTVLNSSRKLCPGDDGHLHDVVDGRQRYVYLACEDDPLHDPAARKWADSPLRPPAK